MDHYPFQCSRTFPNENAWFGGCAIFPFLAAASESGGDLVFSNGCDGSGATKLFEPRCEQGGEPYRVASYIIELRRQATQLIKYEHIQGRTIDHVPIERNPNQAETDILAARATQALTAPISAEVGKVVAVGRGAFSTREI